MLTRSLALLLAACLMVFRAHSADRTIYRCVLAGVTTFSDRPCGESIEIHSLESSTTVTPAVPKSGATASVSELTQDAAKPVRAAPAARANSPNHKDSRARECVRLDAELRRLRARMRAGYRAAEGDRLRERQRTANARRRELQCR
jgi:hypothetical protein